jgi:talin
VSDVESKRGRPAILDTAQFINYSQRIQDTCASLHSALTSSGTFAKLNSDTQKQLIHAATQIAHNTAGLCNASQQASSKTPNVLAKRHFVQSAKQVANATAHFVKSIKSLEQNELSATVDIRQETYASLVKPLLDSVESLCQYALSPEFASIPAVISENGVRAQEPILQATRTMLDASSQLISASRSLISNNKDPQTWQLFSSNSKTISDSIKKLATSIKEKAPAKLECDQALAVLDKCMKHLESALLNVAMGHTLPLSELANSKSLQAYQEHAISCANQITELVDQLRVAAKGEADKLGHLVTEIGQYFEPLVVNVIGCAAKTPFNSQQQAAFLEQTKTVLESSFQLMIASKESAGNPKNTANLHQTIDENADGTKEVLDDLIQTLEEATAQNGYVTTMVENLSKSIAIVDLNSESFKTGFDEGQEQADVDENQKQMVFVECQTKIVQMTRSLQKHVKDLSLCDMSELGQNAQHLTQTFNYLIFACKGAMTTCSNGELSKRIKVTTQDLGKACIELVNLGEFLI